MKKSTIAGFVGLGLLGVFIAGSMVLSEVRPVDLDLSPASAARGRAHLQRMAEAHGLAHYQAQRQVSVAVEDQWLGTVGAWANPFPQPTTHLRLEFGAHEWRVNMELLDEPQKGEVWAFAPDRRITHGRSGGPLMPAQPTDLSAFFPADFMLPTYRYFLVAPFELLTAEWAYDVGERTIDGVRCDVVFATWGSLEAHAEADQYLVYVDHQTGLLRRLEYTVHESARSALGAANYSGVQVVDGVSWPEQISIRALMPIAGETEIHVTKLESVRFLGG